MRASTRKPRKITSRFSKREKLRRNPFQAPEQTLDFVAPLVHLPVVPPRVTPGLAQRHPRIAPPGQRKLAWLVAFLLPRPSTPTAALAGRPGAGAASAPRAQHGPVQGTARTSPLRAQPRQPDASWRAIPRGTYHGPVDRFVSRPRPSGVHLQDVPSSASSGCRRYATARTGPGLPATCPPARHHTGGH